jgi:hypothetical protein
MTKGNGSPNCDDVRNYTCTRPSSKRVPCVPLVTPFPDLSAVSLCAAQSYAESAASISYMTSPLGRAPTERARPLTAPEEDERRGRQDGEVVRDVRLLLRIQLHDSQVVALAGKLCEVGGDRSACSRPGHPVASMLASCRPPAVMSNRPALRPRHRTPSRDGLVYAAGPMRGHSLARSPHRPSDLRSPRHPTVRNCQAAASTGATQATLSR